MKCKKTLRLGQISATEIFSLKFLNLCFLVLIAFEIQGQELNPKITFSTYYGSTGTDDADVVTVDHMGNTYLGCHSTSKDLIGADQHPYTINGGMDAFIVKVNNEGTDIGYIVQMGGKEWEAIQGIISDPEGNIYAVGTTYSPDFPIHKNGFQTTFGGKSDAFVVKLNSEGKVIWSTFLGGSENEDGRGIALNEKGNIHIVGRTASKNFPVTDKAIQSKSAGGIDAFITTLNSNGEMVRSTYLGGKGDDIGFSIDIDNTGQLYVAGTTNSIDFPIKNAMQEENNGGNDVFLVVIDMTGTVISYASYLGGKGTDQLYDIDIDSSGNVFILGVTDSSNYPTTRKAFQSNFGGVRDAFITRINLQKREMVYSTYLGGEKDDNPSSLQVSEKGDAFIVGNTASENFPIVNSQEINISGSHDAFIACLNSNGLFLHYSTLFGGRGKDFFEGLAIGSDGSITVSGGSNSIDFPIMNPIQDTFLGGRFDMIVTRFVIPNKE
ncbi:SBBP repeat-containing protein [uncultured Croceitalea sp.]|uniref:SBBP repeat-containing protein n=1 Tax=uncultured Croceitalea sp. TaxID=1798908 RepID=UPI0033061645